MNRLLRLRTARLMAIHLTTAILLAALASCSSAPPKRINPPVASVQQLATQADGSWQLTLRVQNFSNVTMRFDTIEAALTLDAAAAGQIYGQVGLDIPGNAADTASFRLVPTAAARSALASARTRGFDYRLTGAINVTEPTQKRFDFLFDSRLSPVPGMADTYR